MSKDKKKKSKVEAQDVELDLSAAPEDAVEGDLDTEEVNTEVDSETEEVSVEATDNVEATEAAPKAKKASSKVVIPKSSIQYFAEFPVEDIKPRERTTRYRTKDTQTVLAEMIQKFGWVAPITLDEEFRIVDGQYRYELAKKWKLETIPAVVSSGVSADDGTTDLFHMLSGRIVEWDKWNFPETNEVLKSLDGGMGTEKVLGYETVSERGELRDLARKLGWFVQVIPTTLSGSTVTLETLGGLLKKQLAGKYQYDPAQLLYIEALRTQLAEVRQRMVDRGDTAGGVKEKLDRHKSEEAAQLKRGQELAEAQDIDLEISEDGTTAVFSADKEIEYVISELAELEASAKRQIKSARDWSETFKEMSDGKKLGLFQFRMLAVEFDGMTEEEAVNVFNSTSAEELNAIVDRILEENKTLSPNRSKNFPMTKEELAAEKKRLREEDARKEREKKEGPAGKKQGLDAMTLAPLRAIAKAAEVKITGMTKAEIIAALRAAGVNEDGTVSAESVEATPEESAEPTIVVMVDEHAELMAESDENVSEESTEPVVVATVTSEDGEILPITASRGGSGKATVAHIKPVEEDIFGDDDEDLFAPEAPVSEDAAVAEEEPEDAPEEVEKPAKSKKDKADKGDKAAKKRFKELKKMKAEGELSKAEKKEFKALKESLAS